MGSITSLVQASRMGHQIWEKRSGSEIERAAVGTKELELPAQTRRHMEAWAGGVLAETSLSESLGSYLNSSRNCSPRQRKPL